ncbi:MAG: DedA family protein [Pseudomonadota bacterium]|nr:DedA family protein [Pseudomonadota bacterium]
MLSSLTPYAGILITAFASATLLPGQSEVVMAAMLVSERYDPLWLFLAATTGNSLGSTVNWLMGRFIEIFGKRRWFPFSAASVENGRRWYAKWGKWSLLLSWVPVIGDALTLAAGLMRTPLSIFLPLVIAAKAGRYLLLMAMLSAAT